MHCSCRECGAIQHARTIIDSIDLMALCSSQAPENFEVALNISTADKHLKDAQAVLLKKHTTIPSSNDNLRGNGLSAPPLLKHNLSGSTSTLSPNDRGSKHAPSPSAEDRALVIFRQDGSPSKQGSNSSLQGTPDRTPTTAKRGSAPEQSKDSARSKEEIDKQLTLLRQFGGKRQVSNPWAGQDDTAPAASKSFEGTIRNKAAELGILRGMTTSEDGSVSQDTQFSAVVNIRDTKDPIKEKTRFIVCDHCRSHGLRCNESSVCKECVMREIPCTHRQCDQSPVEKDLCPRQVCFYVHANWMPGVFGVHDPEDPNWIVLPGKLREHLSAGPLSKLPPPDEAEIVRCYANVNERQQKAMAEITRCVENGEATWETMAMSCPCAEIEHENLRALQADENVRRLEAMGSKNANAG